MVSIISALYGLAMVFVFCLAFVVLPAAPSITNLLLFFFVLLTFLLRTLYLALYAAGYFHTEDTVSFLLVEPPSFFLLSIASLFIMTYGFCLYCLKANTPQQSVYFQIWIYWAFFTIALYLLMAVVIILLNELDREDEVSVYCYGREVFVSPSFTVETIRIVYHTILLVLASAATIAIFILARQIEKSLEAQSLFTLNAISTLPVMLTSVLWVIYSAISGASPYFVIPLWFCECPLLVATCLYLRFFKK
jgi:hypothetical protein